MAQTIFERVGGFASVRKVVSAFYDKVLDSPALEHHFTNVSMPRLIDHQTQFIAAVMGGPASISDDMLRRAHANLKISDKEFQEVAQLLRETLEDTGVDSADVEHVCREVLRREVYIVTRRE